MIRLSEKTYLRERLKQVEHERDEYAKCVSAMLVAAAKLSTGTLSGGAKALVAGSLIRKLRARR